MDEHSDFKNHYKKFEQLEFKLEKILGFRNMQENGFYELQEDIQWYFVTKIVLTYCEEKLF